MICIHAYFHIYLQAKKGLAAYTKRRTAILKISRLPILSARTVYLCKQNSLYENESDENERNDKFNKKLNDLCAICFCELKTLESRILQCSHCFHSTCLRKWLHVQSTCPMCQKAVN